MCPAVCYLVRFLAILVVAGAAPPSWGHGDVHKQIVDVSAQIREDPRNAGLYLRRGELYRVNQHWDNAQADYDHALSIDPGLKIIDFLRGRLYLEAGWPHSAQVALDRFLAGHTNHVDGLITRARVLNKLEQQLEAAADYTRAIRFATESRPELYIERAQVLTAAGPNHFDEALRGLDEGVAKLGSLVTLQLYAIDLEIKQGTFDRALARLERIAAQSPRKETWLARRGEILKQAGRPAQAKEAFQAAMSAMNKLPSSRRNVPAMIELEKRVKAELASLSADVAPKR